MTDSSRRMLIFRRIGVGLFVIITGLLLAFSVVIFTGDNIAFSARLVWSRCLLVLVAFIAVIGGWLTRRGLIPRLRRFCLEAGSPERLGLFRVVVMSLLVLEVLRSQPQWFTELPDALRVAPWGLEWMTKTPLFDSRIASAGEWVCCTFGVAAAIGFQTRWTVPMATVLATWLLALPHFDGKVDHGHHVVWFAMLLSASRCGDAFSVDRWLSRSDSPTDSIEYSWPIKFAWLLIGVAYFFPGFWKVWNCGLDWIAPDSMARQIHAKWIELESFQPTFKIDQYPMLLALAGGFTIVLELGFLPLVVFRRTRFIAVSAGLLFHFGTWAFMGIAFTSLQICYVCFIPDHWLTKTQQDDGPSSARPDLKARRWLACTSFVGLMLLLGNSWCGSRHLLESWPFSCYPTFDYFASGTSAKIVVEETLPSKHRIPVDTRQLLYPMDSSGELRLLSRIFSAATSDEPSNADRKIVHQFSQLIRDSRPASDRDAALEFLLYQVTWSDGQAKKNLVHRTTLAP